MFRDLFGLWPIKGDIATGKGHKGELVLGQELFQFCGFEICDGIGTKLNPGKSDRGDIVDRLPLIAAPGHGGVTKANARVSDRPQRKRAASSRPRLPQHLQERYVV